MPTKDRNRDYLELLSLYPGEEKFRERVTFLYAEAEILLKHYNLIQEIVIDRYLLTEITIDYFTDIKRLKDFHTIEKTNNIKVGAYLAYWILKHKPLHIKHINDEKLKNNRFVLNINEWFAKFILYVIIFDFSKLYMNQSDLSQELKFTENLIYYMTYRVVTAQSLELTMLALTTEFKSYMVK